MAFEAVEHTDALLVSRTQAFVSLTRHVALQVCDVQVVNGLRDLTSGSVDAFDSVLHVTIGMSFGEVCGSTVGRTKHLRSQLKSLLAWPGSGRAADFQVQLT